MAKSMNEINMDYHVMKMKADELDQIAKALEQNGLRELDIAMSSLSSGWKSDTAAAYARKANTLKENLKKQVIQIQKDAETLRRIAKNTYDEEMKAYQNAQQRSNKR